MVDRFSSCFVRGQICERQVPYHPRGAIISNSYQLHSLFGEKIIGYLGLNRLCDLTLTPPMYICT